MHLNSSAVVLRRKQSWLWSQFTAPCFLFCAVVWSSQILQGAKGNIRSYDLSPVVSAMILSLRLPRWFFFFVFFSMTHVLAKFWLHFLTQIYVIHNKWAKGMLSRGLQFIKNVVFAPFEILPVSSHSEHVGKSSQKKISSNSVTLIEWVLVVVLKTIPFKRRTLRSYSFGKYQASSVLLRVEQLQTDSRAIFHCNGFPLCVGIVKSKVWFEAQSWVAPSNLVSP